MVKYTFYKPSIPAMFAVLVLTNSSQVYQVYLYMDSCRDYIPQPVLRRNRMILLGYGLLYLALFILITINSPYGPRCHTHHAIFGKSDTYPVCFILLFLVDFLFFIFSTYQRCHTYEIDQEMLDSEASR